jgi:hypothetical protein
MDGGIGIGEINHADRTARGRVVDGAKVEVGELIGREQGEAPPPGHTAGQIVGKVIVGGNARARADPQADDGGARAQIERVFRLHPIEMARHVDGAQVDQRGIGGGLVVIKPGENIAQPPARHAEIHAHVGVVKQPPLIPWRSDGDGKGHIARPRQQIGAHIAGRAARGLNHGPMRHQPAQHERLTRAAQHLVERCGIGGGDLAHGGQDGGRGGSSDQNALPCAFFNATSRENWDSEASAM